jgi:DNA topoisomerase III
MHVLCVAEKPSIAKAITQILSGGQFAMRQSPNRYTKNYDFNYPQTNSTFTVTSVSGHVMAHEFSDTHRIWSACDPFVLFDAPISLSVPAENKGIEKNLIAEARKCGTLMIWTDCDREGEHIGSEIAKICRKARSNIIVKRARFSAIIAQYVRGRLLL